MNDLASKFSLYDILSMVIPGGTVLLCLASQCDSTVLLDTNREVNIADACQGFILQTKEIGRNMSALLWFAALILSYMIGIVNHTVTSLIWSPFRNCPEMIELARQNKKMSGLYIMKKCQGPLGICPFICWYVSLVLILLIVEGCTCWQLLSEYKVYGIIGVLCVCYLCVLLFNGKFCEESKQFNELYVKNDYFRKYYYVAKNTYRKDIFVMEGQVAFMQNMVIPLIVLVIVSNFGDKCYPFYLPSVIGFTASCLLVLLVPAIFHRQMKIYGCVFEDFRYLGKIDVQTFGKRIIVNTPYKHICLTSIVKSVFSKFFPKICHKNQ